MPNGTARTADVVPRDCYNSYFYAVEDPSLNVLDKFRLHGRRYVERLTGGWARHMNLDEHLSKAQYRQAAARRCRRGDELISRSTSRSTVCNDCGRHRQALPESSAPSATAATRQLSDAQAIGYLKVRVSNFSKSRVRKRRPHAITTMLPQRRGKAAPAAVTETTPTSC